MAKKNFIASGGLDKDTAVQYIKEGDWIDAKNINIETGNEGGSYAVKNIHSYTRLAQSLEGSLTGGVKVIAAVSDNDGILYVLLRNETEAIIVKILLDNTFVELVKYNHQINIATSDFDPDIKIIGEVLVWNYYGNGVPLSWVVTRTGVVSPNIVDLSLIKKPPVFTITTTPTSALRGITGVFLDSTDFDENDAAVLVGNLTFTKDIATNSGYNYKIVSALNDGLEDVSSRFEIVVAKDGSGVIAFAELRTIGGFDHTVVNDRDISMIIACTNQELGVQFSQVFTITLNNTPPLLDYSDAYNVNETDTGILISPLLAQSGTNVSSLTGCTFTLTNNLTDAPSDEFEIDAATGEISYKTGGAAVVGGFTYPLKVTLTDGSASTATDSFDVIIASSGSEVPVAVDFSRIISGSFIGALQGTDPISRDLEYQIVSQGFIVTLVVSNPATGAISGSFTSGHDGSVVEDLATFKIIADPLGTPVESSIANITLLFDNVAPDVTITGGNGEISLNPVPQFVTPKPAGFDGSVNTYSGQIEILPDVAGGFAGYTISDISPSITSQGAGWSALSLSPTIGLTDNLLTLYFTGDTTGLVVNDLDLSITINVVIFSLGK